LYIYNIQNSLFYQEQLKDLFIKIGFPEICFERQRFDFGKTGIDDEPQLDVISAILTMGFYPNVCYHKEKRKVTF